jgi:AcrR family transcriptional regulator
MDAILKNLRVEINSELYLKDPESSPLGLRIVQHSIELIYELGFEQFTFKKLGERLGSNESSIYRYFENKHKLLLYLTAWYWSWIENQLVISTLSISTPQERLFAAIDVVSAQTVEDSNYAHVNEILLNKIVIAESSKVFHTKEVDKENSAGYFSVYKRLCNRLSEMIKAVNRDYPFSSSLASTIIDGSLQQHFLKTHIPAITDCDANCTPADYFKDLINRILN